MWPEEKEYRVKVTDEAGNGVPNVWVKFTEGKKYNLVPADSSGVAVYKTTSDDVSASFHDAAELGTAMQSVWGKAAALVQAQWLKPEVGKRTVLSIRGGALQEQLSDTSEASTTENVGGAAVASAFAAGGTKAASSTAAGAAESIATRAAASFKAFDRIALVPGQEHEISVQPHVAMARLVGVNFDTNKSFLLPTALPTLRRIKELYEAHSGETLMIVGHADSQGGVAANEKLSLERAQAVMAFLLDDVDAWMAWYGANDTSKCWGAGEDRQMLRGIVARKAGLAKPDAKSYQTWHNALAPDKRAKNWEPLEEDGKLGPITRAQLIGDYMNLDGTTLPTNMRVVIHGCGEAFPLPPAANGCAWERFSEMRNRRVEFFFFEQAGGVAPSPASNTSALGSTEYPAWLAKAEVEDLTTEAGLKEVTFVEMHDALFRTNSAVILPEGEDPTTLKGGGRAVTAVGLFATVLRYNERFPGKKLFIAGHTDTRGSDKFNQPLSEERAKVALALLLGQPDEFIKLCVKRHDEVDITQIFDWSTKAFGFTCKPTTLTAPPSTERYQQFRASFNNWVDEWDPVEEVDPRSSSGKIAGAGRLDEFIWRAIFDLYEYDLRLELEENASGVAELRSKLAWVDTNRKSLGFGERFPVDNLTKNEFRSQSNRRIEMLMFDSGEEPDLAAIEAEPVGADLYLLGAYSKIPVAVSSAGPEYAWVDSDSLVDLPNGPDIATPAINDPISEEESDDFRVTCRAVNDAGNLAPRCAAQHGNVSPSLVWSGQPEDTKELVLVFCDPDASDYLHWVVRDISPAATTLPEATKLPPANITKGAIPMGTEAVAYRGPEPPTNEAHRYLFRLYALTTPLKGRAIPSKFSELDDLLMNHGATIAEAFAFYREL
ncbi:MAG: YbhB/YbcL family Raf kinase inhibitor-like protein [Polyangiaceae bacterium]